MPRLATTVLLLRPESEGFSVFMVQRHGKSGFLPEAWVFPGGRLEQGDRLADHPAVRGGERALTLMGLDRDEAVAMLVAGVRETFEESGIWLGGGSLPARLRDPLARDEIDLGDVLVEHDVTLDLDRLAPWSWWITPTSEPRRYDTRFLVAVTPGARGAHDERETVDSGWYRPLEALGGDFALAPPTWWTLRELAAFERAEQAFAAAWARPQRPIQPILHAGDEGLELRLPGHPEHPEAAIEGVPSRIGFDQGRWWADGSTLASG